MTPLPDWLVERAALDEVPAASRDRLAALRDDDARELADRVAALREDDARELRGFPAGPAVAQIEARAAVATRRRAERKRRVRAAVLGAATTCVAVVLAAHFVFGGKSGRVDPAGDTAAGDDGTRVKGRARLIVFRNAGDRAEQLAQDALVREGDVLQLRYNAGGRRYGVIASVDGAGVVTLHYPGSEDAPAEATALAAETTSLPHAYSLDDAPRFERFFFITANDPIDLRASLAALHELAQRDDSADAELELPAGLRQWSLRLRKPDRTSSNHVSP
ncbi:MAG TPA: hypothetical protein VMJ10_06325 [Kofleriaceae bacterium]|nr:hypothetical protein [Kofleriaceae bacterium]